MMEPLLKRYPKSVDKKGKKEYAIQYGQEAYLDKEPRQMLDMKKVYQDKRCEQ